MWLIALVSNTSWQTLVTLCLTFVQLLAFLCLACFHILIRILKLCIYIFSINLKLDTFDSGVIYSFICVWHNYKMLSTYGIMLVKFNLITFFFQPLCIFYTHSTLHFKHFDNILLVGLAWFCWRHRGQEKTGTSVELFFVFLTIDQEAPFHFWAEMDEVPAWNPLWFCQQHEDQECFHPRTEVSEEVLETCGLFQCFVWCTCSLLGIGTHPPGEPCERHEPSTMVWWKFKWARACAKFAEDCLRLTLAQANEWFGFLTSRQELQMG